jgi:hypothetical protein
MRFKKVRRPSFLEKRSKKLPPILAAAFPERLGLMSQKFFGSFFQKRTASCPLPLSA